MTNDTPHTPTPQHARYDGRWYFCWLIERRDMPQPEWWGADCQWHKDANQAEWYARKSDAETVAGDMAADVVVCEHGFDLGDAATIDSHDALERRAEAAEADMVALEQRNSVLVAALAELLRIDEEAGGLMIYPDAASELVVALDKARAALQQVRHE